MCCTACVLRAQNCNRNANTHYIYIYIYRHTSAPAFANANDARANIASAETVNIFAVKIAESAQAVKGGVGLATHIRKPSLWLLIHNHRDDFTHVACRKLQSPPGRICVALHLCSLQRSSNAPLLHCCCSNTFQTADALSTATIYKPMLHCCNSCNACSTVEPARKAFCACA